MSNVTVTDPTAVAAAMALRHRAEVLRQLAHRLNTLRVLTLYVDAGVDTWMGPSPQACADACRSHRSRLLAQVDELFVTARRFDTRAAEMGR